MSEAVALLTVPQAREAAHRIYDRLDRALTLRRGLDGIPDRDLVSVVVLARQLDRLALAAARAEAAWCPAGDDPGSVQAAADASANLRRLLSEAGYLPLPEATEPEAPSHG